jgi:hypothetical protein
MLKEATMNFRVEPDLKEDFAHFAQMDSSAGQVLRQFMRAYVAEARDQQRRVPANDTISAAERRRREEAVRFARASVGLEGFKPSKDAEEQATRFINGEITLSEFIQVNTDAEQVRHR